jgi:hypothetical protein
MMIQVEVVPRTLVSNGWERRRCAAPGQAAAYSCGIVAFHTRGLHDWQWLVLKPAMEALS